jgi:AraC-like DNA-binding protein
VEVSNVEITTDIRSVLQQSRKFRQWKPAKTKAFGIGKEFRSTGKTFKNLAKANEKHYTVADVSTLWGISEDLVRDIFRDETGVLKIRRPATKMKRAYSTLRIPESTLNRVYSELCNEAPDTN